MKKTLAIILAFTMITGLCACGGSQDSGKGEDSTVKTTQNDAQENAGDTKSKESPENADSATSGGEVNLRILLQETSAESVEAAIAPYLEQHPNVKVELVKSPDFVAMNQNAIAAHQANDDYDLITVNHVDTLAYVKGEIIQPIEEFAKADGINYEDIIFNSLLEQGKSDGQLYAIPINTGTRVLAVNKELFEKYGQKYPETQKEMLEAAAALTRDGNFGFVNSMCRNSYVPTYEQGVFLMGNGGRLYEIEDGHPVAKIDTQEMKDFLNFNVELLKYMPKDCLTMTEDDGRKAFATGNVGMYVFGPWEYSLMPEVDFTCELVKIPSGTKEQASTSGGFQMAIGSGTKNPGEAWNLLKYITTTPEAMASMAATDLPTMEEAYKVAPYTDKKYDIFREQLETAYLAGIPVPNLNEVSEDFFSYWTDVLYGKISVDEACTKAQESVQKLLDKNK